MGGKQEACQAKVQARSVPSWERSKKRAKLICPRLSASKKHANALICPQLPGRLTEADRQAG
jgi:hypothetical protein